MKKMKKIVAMLLALTMVLGMSLTSMAEEPEKGNSEDVTVNNVETGAKLNAYQLIKAKYGTNDKGFVKYVWAFDFSYTNEAGTLVTITEDSDVVFDDDGDIPLLTSELVTKLAANTSDLTKAEEVTVTGVSAEMNLEVGTWMILVTPSSTEDIKVYNPMIASVYYATTGSGDDAEVVAPGVSAGSNWTLVTTDAYVKSSGVTLTKDAATTWNIGDMVEYTVTTTVPDYSDAYVADDIKFEIVDTVVAGELEIQNTEENPITVNIPTDEYTLNATKDGYTLTVAGDWIAENKNATITITYKAKLVGDIYANDTGDNKAHDNEVVLTYTNSLKREEGEYTVDTETVYESVYTFKVVGKIIKTGEDIDDDGTPDPIVGKSAVFTIYTDSACTTVYTNAKHPNGTVTSDPTTGAINLYGLDSSPEGKNYYIKETVAPEGYSLNDEVFCITVKADETRDAEKKVKNTVNNIVITVTDSDGVEISTIPNTKLNSLPSTGGIGTTIFTVAGCGIMVAAAYLFFASRKKEN